jgi:hypothetical protein
MAQTSSICNLHSVKIQTRGKISEAIFFKSQINPDFWYPAGNWNSRVDTERLWHSHFYSWRHYLAIIARSDRDRNSQLRAKDLVAFLIW